MTRLNVNPTRMELKKLKVRLKTATRGHKLLKDKSDEMVRRFSVIIKENKRLRGDAERDVARVLKQFAVARSLTKKEQIEMLFSMPAVSVQVECGVTSIMNVETPVLSVVKTETEKYPYSFASITGEADYSVELIGSLIEKLVKLAETEKTAKMLAVEIEKNKRRVNALEYVMIPQLNETIKYIELKLDENERGGLVRLMKVKSMIAARSEE